MVNNMTYKKENETDNSNSAGFLKIRQYVVDLIYRSGNVPQKIPSSRKLGEIFGVTHPTALRAIQDLVADGYLIPCKGGGSITKPLKNQPLKIVGLIDGGGKNAFYSQLASRVFSAVSNEFLRRSESYALHPLVLTGPLAESEELIRKYDLTGLIWIDAPSNSSEPAKILKNLKKAGMPVVAFGNPVEDISSGGWDFEPEHYQIFSKLLAEGRRHFLVINGMDEKRWAAAAKGEARALKDYNIPQEQVIVVNGNPDEVKNRVQDLLNYGLKFDVVMFTAGIGPYLDFFREKMDVENNCRLISGELTTYDDMKFTGYLVRRKLAKAAKTIIDNFEMQMQSPDTAPTIFVPVEIEMELMKDGQTVS